MKDVFTFLDELVQEEQAELATDAHILDNYACILQQLWLPAIIREKYMREGKTCGLPKR